MMPLKQKLVVCCWFKKYNSHLTEVVLKIIVLFSVKLIPVTTETGRRLCKFKMSASQNTINNVFLVLLSNCFWKGLRRSRFVEFYPPRGDHSYQNWAFLCPDVATGWDDSAAASERSLLPVPLTDVVGKAEVNNKCSHISFLTCPSKKKVNKAADRRELRARA